MTNIQNRGVSADAFQDLFLQVTRPESRRFKPYSVPQEQGFARMHQNESYLPLNKTELADLHNEFLEVLQAAWSGNDSSPHVYPSLVPVQLRAAFADRLEVRPEQVEVFCGSSEALLTIASGCFRPGSKIAFLDPSFSLLADLVQFWGAKHEPIALDENMNCLRESLFSDAVLGADVVILCSPNNPTGGVVPAEWIAEFVGLAKGLVVIDEAYFEFARHLDKSHVNFVPLAVRAPNAVVLRTLSKAWGAAGLRVGALVGHEKWVRFFAGLRRPYSIPQPSEILGAHVLCNKVQLMEKIVSNATTACAAIQSALVGVPDLRVFPSAGNFLLIDTPHAKQIASLCYAEQMIVRQFEIAEQGNALPCVAQQAPSSGAKPHLRVNPWSPAHNKTLIRIIKEVHAKK